MVLICTLCWTTKVPATLARTEFFDMMNIPRSTMTTYTLTSCSGQHILSGRQAKGFVVESADGSSCLDLPVITECSEIPDVETTGIL